jgi:hypothetical protein
MKHTILYVAANPRGTDKLALDRECEALQNELRLTDDRDYFEFHSRWAVGVDHLMRALNEMSPTILHFSGHGTGSVASTASSHGGMHRDVQSPCGAGILLEGLDGAQHVGHRALADMIASVPPVPRLVVLNACHSADVADSLREVVDCVVGVDGAIEDTAAREFTVGFYRALGYRRHSIGTAVKQARATMYAKQLPGQLVTCHPRNGANADDIYLAASSRARDLGDGPERERSQRESPSGNERTSEPPAHEARDATGTTAVRATSQPMGSSAWPAVAAAPARDARDGSTTSGRAVSRPIGSGGWPAVAEPYDLFLAHPSANRATASALYDLLQSDLRVFLACRSLSPSDRREQAVAAAQRNSRAAVLLISPQADASWYLGDECITAITLHRAAPDVHPILPVLLAAGIPLPRCLSDIEPIVAPAAGDLAGVAAQLRELLAALPRAAAPWSTAPLDRRANGDHVRLYARLGQLTDAVFEQIVARAKIDPSSFAPRTAALAQRALDIAQLAALDPALCQRVSTELDRHAPWTRR